MTRWWGRGKWCCGGSEGRKLGRQENPERSLCSLAGLKPGLYTSRSRSRRAHTEKAAARLRQAGKPAALHRVSCRRAGGGGTPWIRPSRGGRGQEQKRGRSARGRGRGWRRGDGALGGEGEVGAFGWELDAAVEAEAGFAEEFGAKAHVFGAIHTPEPELFFVALEEIHGLFELLHGFVEVGSQEKDA